MEEQQPRRVQVALFALISATAVASLIGTALAPYLLVKNPLLLVAISPASHHVALAAASVEPLPLVTVATVRRVMTALGAYGLGYLYGRGALAWLEQRHARLARFVGWVERLFTRWGVWLLVPAPTATVALLAGAARSRLVSFLIAITLGQALWNGITVYVGDAVSARTELFLGYLGEHLLESTLVCVALVTLQQALARWLRRRRQTALAQ